MGSLFPRWGSWVHSVGAPILWHDLLSSWTHGKTGEILVSGAPVSPSCPWDPGPKEPAKAGLAPMLRSCSEPSSHWPRLTWLVRWYRPELAWGKRSAESRTLPLLPPWFEIPEWKSWVKWDPRPLSAFPWPLMDSLLVLHRWESGQTAYPDACLSCDERFRDAQRWSAFHFSRNFSERSGSSLCSLRPVAWSQHVYWAPAVSCPLGVEDTA